MTIATIKTLPYIFTILLLSGCFHSNRDGYIEVLGEPVEYLIKTKEIKLCEHNIRKETFVIIADVIERPLKGKEIDLVVTGIPQGDDFLKVGEIWKITLKEGSFQTLDDLGFCYRDYRELTPKKGSRTKNYRYLPIEEQIIGSWSGNTYLKDDNNYYEWVSTYKSDGTYSCYFSNYYLKDEKIDASLFDITGKWWIEGEYLYEFASHRMDEPDVYLIKFINEDILTLKVNKANSSPEHKRLANEEHVFTNKRILK